MKAAGVWRPLILRCVRLRRFVRSNKVFSALFVAVVLLTLVSRVSIAYYLANDDPGDGILYAQLARNILEQGVFSIDDKATFAPTLIRLPGYPLFLAGVYSVFGHENNTAARVLQGVIDTGTCVLAAFLAWLWAVGRRRKKRAALAALILAGLCPFIAIYSATILTETLTTFLMAAMAVAATVGLRSRRSSLIPWLVCGVLAGLAVLLRPDSGLFSAGIGITLAICGIFLDLRRATFVRRFGSLALRGAIFTAAFCLILAPWAIRNYQVFGVFQPLAPAHAEMPGEFVAYGYFHWLRTWVDDSRFTEPMLWNLEDKRIYIGKVPASAFDSPEERDQVASLLHQYNHPPGADDDDSSSGDDAADNSDSGDDDQQSDSADSGSPDDEDQADAPASPDQEDDEDDDSPHTVEMTPEIDAEFEKLAEQRVERSPARYYLWVPAKRAAALWFDSHSLYYPFGGQMSPIADLDYDVAQQYWLPAFTLLMWAYTLLAFGGAVRLWKERVDKRMLRWLILLALMTLPRVIFFATIENPEPRYVVELFFFAAVAGGIFIASIKRRERPREPLPNDRMLSLDVFRGLTIAAMTLVSEPGTWSAVYAPLNHAGWNGATPTDLIFPFFLFIVGVSVSISLGERPAARGVYAKVIKRSFFLFALGLLLEAFPFYNLWNAQWFEPGEMRIMGVLQRIAICYLIAALLFLKTGWKTQVGVAVGILLGYWALMTLIDVPGCAVTTVNDQGCNFAAYVDRLVLGTNHFWDRSRVYDPEGLLSTLPAIATTLIGVLAGLWLRSSASKKAVRMIAAGGTLTLLGWSWSFVFPLNKILWTSSYVLYTGGIALLVFGALYWFIDVKGYRRWAFPFVVLGTNAIALYIGSTVFGKILNVVALAAPDNTTVSLQERIFNGLFLPLASPVDASLFYAITFLLLWLLMMWLLYWRRIFFKV